MSIQNERKPYVVKFLKLYCYLIEKGYKELYSRPDMNNSRYKVWIFNNTDELYNDIQEFWKQQGK